jgi:hypothetical protein
VLYFTLKGRALLFRGGPGVEILRVFFGGEFQIPDFKFQIKVTVKDLKTHQSASDTRLD